MMKKPSPARSGSDGHDLAAALAPYRDTILSQLIQTWRVRAPKTTVMLGTPQRAVEAAESIGAAWFAWLENVGNLNIVRELAADLVRQGLTYTTASTLVQSLTTIVTDIAAKGTQHEVAALKLTGLFSAACLDHIATQHELRTYQEQERLAVQLQASAEVSRAVTSILDTDQLLREVVNLITDRFGFYYTAVFTLDHTGQYAVLREATGQAGEILKNLNHKLDIYGQAMVGAAITSQRPQVAAEAGRDVPRFSNPLLPDTQSEIALPLSVGDRVLGALDVQSTEPRAFDETNVTVLQNMADQIAIALENARLFERAQANLAESQTAQANLARNQAQLADALRIAQLGYWEYDVERDLFTFNDHFYAIFHTTAEAEGGYQISSARYAQKFVHPDDAAVVGEEIGRALASTDRHYSKQLDHRILYADGGVGYITVRLYIDRDEAGHIIRYYGANEDITDRKGREQDVLRFKLGLERSGDAVFMTDTAGSIQYVNPAFEKVYGYTPAEAVGQTPRILKSGVISPEQYATFWQTLLSKGVVAGEIINRHKDGRQLVIEGSNSPIIDESGGLLGFLAVHRNITERKQAEQALRRNEMELSEALRIAQLGNWSYDVPTDTFTFNDQFYVLMRTTAEREGGYTLSSAQYTQRFVHPDDAAMVGAEIGKALVTTDPNYRGQIDHRIYYGDGEPGYITVRYYIEQDEQGRTIKTHGANQDITERKLAEVALRRGEAQLSEALRIAHLGYWEYDVETDQFLFNDQFYSLLRTTAEAEGGYEMSSARYAQKFVHPEDATLVGQEIGLARQSTELNYSRQIDHRIIYADGLPGYITVRFRVERDADGRPSKFIGANEDITARRQIELDLAQERNLLRTLIDTLPERIFAKDRESRFTLANAAEIRLDGASSFEELRGKNDFDFYPVDLAQQYYDAERPIIEEGRSLIGYEERSVDQDGNTLWHISTKVPLRDTDGRITGLVGMTRDITAMKEAEAERERLLAEQRVRATQLQTAAEIGRVATSILNPDQLLREIVNLVAVRFDFYHVAAYTVDDSGRWALLRDATGEVGQQLKDRGQALAIRGQSIVGRAIRQRQPQTALDVGPDAVQFNDPLLPGTRSELALPLFVGEQVLGVLDVHSIAPAAFDESFAVLLQGMVDQIAVALHNAEQYQREQAHINQTNRLMQIVIDLSERTDRPGLQNRLVQSALSLLDTDRAQFWLTGAGGLELKAAQSVRPGADQSLAISQELAARVCGTGLPLRLDSPPVQAGYASRITDVPFNAALITPVSWQGSVVGVLSVMRSQPGRPFTQDDENSAQLLAAQAAAALENIMLSEQQQHRAVQLQTAAEVSRASSTILQPEELLNTVVELVRDNFNLYYVGIFLLDEQAEWAYLRAGTGEAGRKMLQAGHRLRVDESSMIGWSIVHRQARIALDVGADAVRFDNPLLPNTRSEMALPLISRGRITGAATIQSTQPAAFTSDDATILQTMADQITTAAENARLFERSQQSVQHMTILNEIMRAISQEIELEWVLESAYQGVQRLLPVDTFSVALHDRATDRIAYPMIADGGQSRSEPASPIDPASPVGRVIHTAEPVLENLSREGRAAIDSGQPDDAARPAASLLIVPLQQGNQTIGALSVQTHQFDAYTREHVELLENVASQLSVAIVNAQLLEQTRQAADELNALNRRLTGEAWQSYVQTRSPEAVIWHANDPMLSRAGSAQTELLAAGKVAVERVAGEPDISPTDGDYLISVPIALRGQLIGALRFRAPADKWTDEAQAIATSIAGHLAQAAENTRLIEQTQRTALRERQIAQAADKIHRESDLQAILQIAVQEIARITGAADVGIQMGAMSTFDHEPRPPHQPNGHSEPTESDHVSTLA